jgi:hypothetical protein
MDIGKTKLDVLHQNTPGGISLSNKHMKDLAEAIVSTLEKATLDTLTANLVIIK